MSGGLDDASSRRQHEADLTDEVFPILLGPEIATAIRAAVLAEREACAKVAEDYERSVVIGPEIAAAIRARP